MRRSRAAPAGEYKQAPSPSARPRAHRLYLLPFPLSTRPSHSPPGIQSRFLPIRNSYRIHLRLPSSRIQVDSNRAPLSSLNQSRHEAPDQHNASQEDRGRRRQAQVGLRPSHLPGSSLRQHRDGLLFSRFDRVLTRGLQDMITDAIVAVRFAQPTRQASMETRAARARRAQCPL